MAWRGYFPTDVELRVEHILRELGIAFSAQHPTRSGFVLDFAIREKKICIEADGPWHERSRARRRDAFRTLVLKREGWKVVRIPYTMGDEDIKRIIRGILQC
jgi:very-short-patch-repair endonuclease